MELNPREQPTWPGDLFVLEISKFDCKYVSDYLSDDDIENLLQDSPDNYLKDYSISEDWDPYTE